MFTLYGFFCFTAVRCCAHGAGAALFVFDLCYLSMCSLCAILPFHFLSDFDTHADKRPSCDGAVHACVVPIRPWQRMAHPPLSLTFTFRSCFRFRLEIFLALAQLKGRNY